MDINYELEKLCDEIEWVMYWATNSNPPLHSQRG